MLFRKLFTIVWMCAITKAHEGHDHGKGIFDESQDISDHDLAHLKDAIKANKPIKEMTMDERQFYYFKQADKDNNDKLDGLEMLQTMIQFELEDAEYGTPFQAKEDKEWIQQIDRALVVQDTNDDGMVDFFEFQAIRNKNKKK